MNCVGLFYYLHQNIYLSKLQSGYLYRYKAILNARRTNENENNSNRQVEYNRHYYDLTNNGPNVPGQEYDIIDSNYNTIDVDRS
jgi:hypothetical protein